MKAKELRTITDNYPNVLYTQIIEKCTEQAMLGGNQYIRYVNKRVLTEIVEKLEEEGFTVQLLPDNSEIIVRW